MIRSRQSFNTLTASSLTSINWWQASIRLAEEVRFTSVSGNALSPAAMKLLYWHSPFYHISVSGSALSPATMKRLDWLVFSCTSYLGFYGTLLSHFQLLTYRSSWFRNLDVQLTGFHGTPPSRFRILCTGHWFFGFDAQVTDFAKHFCFHFQR